MNFSGTHAVASLSPARKLTTSIAAACVLGLSATATSIALAPSAQALPAGVSADDVRAMISAPISVPAGQTTTVSLPMAANASYSGGGWSVSTSGSTATVTAPPEGGQISVPVTANGQSATITLVAEGGSAGAGGTGSDGSGGGNAGGTGGSGEGSTGGSGSGEGSGSSEGSGNGDGGSGGSDGAAGGNGSASTGTGGSGEGGTGESGDANTGTGDVSREENASLPVVEGEKPERQPAEQLDESSAERIELESTIEGNTITAQLGLRQALDFYQRFGNLDQEQFTLRYVDADGNIIQDVQRDIDAAARTLTLTYPEGQAPDNPFYMQLVRNDGSGVEVIVSLTDPNYQRAGEEVASDGDSTAANEDEGSNLLVNGAIGLGIVILLIIIALIIRAIRRRGKSGQDAETTEEPNEYYQN
ncbi:hypothetical protein ACG98H_00070 [Corynebacterium sp. L4756]|uniref:hypothetical protein n=1 Tax=unclassified Corynebacterium TaxID=2624378 RepID=UPI00374DD421